MQSTFVSKSILCMLIINVSLCRAPKPAWLSTTICNARCYWTHRGFDYGYYENGQCKCAPPTVYVFNGMGHDLSDEYIETSLDNDNIIENPVTKYQKYEPGPATTTIIIDTNNVNSQLWKQIVETITKQYSSIKENDLEGLKSTIIDDASAMRYFIMYLRKPLENALEEMVKKKPYTSADCERLLKLLQPNKEKIENSKVQLTPKPNSANQITSPAQKKPITTITTKTKTVSSKEPVVAEPKSKTEKKPNGNAANLAGIKETKQELISSNGKKPQKIFVKMTEEYIDDDGNVVVGHGSKKKANENIDKPTKSAVTSAKSLTDDKQHEVNGSGSESGSWVSEEEYY